VVLLFDQMTARKYWALGIIGIPFAHRIYFKGWCVILIFRGGRTFIFESGNENYYKDTLLLLLLPNYYPELHVTKFTSIQRQSLVTYDSFVGEEVLGAGHHRNPIRAPHLLQGLVRLILRGKTYFFPVMWRRKFLNGCFTIAAAIFVN